jgi:3-oxoacyl-[acyl-carrier protein] reductase
MPETEQLIPVAWITGAGGGLGCELVRQFNDAGWRVAAAFHSSHAFEETPVLWPGQLDVTDAEAVTRLADIIVERWERIDLLINNAGVTGDLPVWQLSDDAWEKVLSVNLKGAFHCSRAAISPMLRQRGGQIINISSFAARHGHAGQSNYVAAKAGLIGLTQSLARELGKKNIRVNAVLPGVMRAGMTSRLSEEQMQTFASANLLGRLNDPMEVASFILFLAGTRNISGQIFQLDSRVSRWC